MIKARVMVRVDPEEVRRGAEVRVMARVERRVPALFMRVMALGSGAVVFRTARMTDRPTARQDFTLGTRFLPGGRSYIVSVAPNRNMRSAGHDSFSVLPRRGPVPLALLLPVLMGRGTQAQRARRGLAVEPGRGRQRPGPPVEREGDTVRDVSWSPYGEWQMGVKVQDPWRTGSPYTRAQVQAILDRERKRRAANPEMRQLPEGSVEDVMRALARDRAERMRDRRRLGADRRVLRYVFDTERDERVCPRCRRLQSRIYPAWAARPAIPLHPNCRCRYVRVVEWGGGQGLREVGGQAWR